MSTNRLGEGTQYLDLISAIIAFGKKGMFFF